MRRRGSLALRIALLSVAVAVITALVAGGIAIVLVRQANLRTARGTLSSLADAAQATANLASGRDTANQQRARSTLQALRVASATVNAQTRKVTGGEVLARDAIGPTDITTLLAGGSLSVTRSVDGHATLIEGRPTHAGAIVLAQRRSDAVAVGDSAVRRLVVALLIALGVAVLLGLVVAWRLARPLRQTAAAAHALAGGRRDVRVVPDGPAEVAEVADALNTLAAALTASEARQREFLLSVSHDLRTPLTAVTGYAESLADGVVPADDVGRVGGVMLAESRRLERLVADLLDLARLGAPDLRVELQWTDIGEVAEAAAQVWSARCAAERLPFRLERPPGPLFAFTDPMRLRQLLDGLFDNALRVTPAGQPIVLAVTPGVTVEVRDGGPGLTDDDLLVAFDRSALYDRYRGVRQVGTGLGLAIVAALATRIGAGVEAGHAVEGGARFTVYLAGPADPDVYLTAPLVNIG